MTEYFKRLEVWLLLIIMLVNVSFAQNSAGISRKKSSDLRAEEIIERARKASNPKNKFLELKGADINYEIRTIQITPTKDSFDNVKQVRLAIEFPKKIFYETYSDFSSNQQLFTQILNIDKYAEENQILVNGKPFDFQSNIGSLNVKTTKEEQMNWFKKKMLITIFPVFFESALYETIDFKYTGEGEVNGVKANVIEAKDNERTLFQLFFDKESGLPLLMMETSINPVTKNEVERKTYYSDYKIESGYLIAHKITSQRGETFTEEKLLKKLLINPTIKPNLFEVKGK